MNTIKTIIACTDDIDTTEIGKNNQVKLTDIYKFHYINGIEDNGINSAWPNNFINALLGDYSINAKTRPDSDNYIIIPIDNDALRELYKHRIPFVVISSEAKMHMNSYGAFVLVNKSNKRLSNILTNETNKATILASIRSSIIHMYLNRFIDL